MVPIVVTAEQAKRIAESGESIEILDPHGKRIAYYTPSFTSGEIAEARRRSEAESGGHTTEEVLGRISKKESQ